MVNAKIAFKHMDDELLREISTMHIRPKIECTASVWSTHLKNHVGLLEKVKRRATKSVSVSKELSYKLWTCPLWKKEGQEET